MADEAKRMAREAEERARADAERVTAAAATPEGQREGLRQLGLIYGALIGVAVLMVQPFLAAPSLDASATVSIIAFSVAIPLLAGLVMVNWQEGFRGRRSSSVSVTVAQSIAQLAAVTGIVAAFWHVTWVAGVTFLVAGVVAIGVHSAGWWRLESVRAKAE
jgi:tetrahydromethanopterin S-methyltransferase subunit G